MHKTQASYLVVAALSFLAVLAFLFFAATDSKSAFIFSRGAGFFALTGAFWVYRFARGRRVLRWSCDLISLDQDGSVLVH